jgi:protein O-mannosyl-transferase
MTKNRDEPSPAGPAGVRPRPRGAWPLWLGGILALTFLAYLPSLGNGFTNWDDPVYVLDNPLVRNPGVGAVLTTPVSGNYHPITIWSLALNYRLSGLHPASYHWLSLLLHLANTALVFLFIRQLTGGRLWTSVVTSLLFGVHPMHVESVAWIAARKDVLYALFYFLSLIAYLRYVDGMRSAWLAAALAGSVLSLLSKPAAVVVPLSLFAIDFYRKRPFGLRLLVEKAPFLLVSLAGGLLALHAQEATGAIQSHQSAPSLQKILFASFGLLMYVVRLFAPVRLSAVYPYPDASGNGAGRELYLALGFVLIFLPAVVYWARRNRAMLFGLAFFLINIVLVLQIFTVGHSFMADRYTYLPYVGLFFALAWWLDEQLPPRSAGAALKPLIAWIVLALVPVSLVQTWTRCKTWRNSETLWSDAIRTFPHRAFTAYADRGRYYYEEAGRFDAALADLDEAIAINPGVAPVWLDRGIVLAELGRNDGALACFDRALELDSNSLVALNNRGVMRMRKGDLEAAVADFSRSIVLQPGSRDALDNRALAYAMLGEDEKSIADRRRIVELDPANPGNYIQLGEIGASLLRLGRPRESVAAFETAFRSVPPGSPRLAAWYLDRSRAWWALGERRRALSDAREAGRLGVQVDSTYLRLLGG